ncbi:MAG: sulfatase, partial [Planctomycetota bacterium]
MTPDQSDRQTVSRRELFQNLGTGIGSIALASLLADDLPTATAATNPLAPKRSHFAPKAKRVIF